MNKRHKLLLSLTVLFLISAVLPGVASAAVPAVTEVTCTDAASGLPFKISGKADGTAVLMSVPKDSQAQGKTVLSIPSELTYNAHTYTVTELGYAAAANILDNSDGSTSDLNRSWYTKVVIPDSVVAIGEKAFQGAALTSIQWGTKVNTIGAAAFRWCTGLTELTIPNSVTDIDGEAFAGSKLTSVTIGSGVQTIGFGAFSACPLTSIAIPESVTEVVANAFLGCSDVKKLTIDAAGGELTLGAGAFKLGSDDANPIVLDSLTLPERITEMTVDSFQAVAARNLTVLTGAAVGKNWPLHPFYVKPVVENLTIGGNITTVEGAEDQATFKFSHFAKLASAVLEEGVTALGSYALASCGTISKLSLPKTLTTFDSTALEGTSVTSLKYAGTVKQWNDLVNNGLPQALQIEGVECSDGTWPSVMSISLDKSAIPMTVGASPQKLTATVLQYGVNSAPEWTSSDPSVASVSDDGTVTAKMSGTCTITASVGGKTAACTVTVTNPATGITVSSTAETITAGEPFQLSAATTPADADGPIVWTSSNTATASVTQEGLVKGVAAGSATITAKVGTKEASCVITVLPAASAITISPATLDLTVGGIEQVALSVTPTDAAEPSGVTWSSSSSAVAAVVGSTTGATISGSASGTATITATASFGSKTLTATCTVKVTNPAKSITLSKSSLDIVKGNSATLTATTDPVNADGTITWTSSDAEVATVTGSDREATIETLKEGTTTITASAASGKTATCIVTVTELTEPKGITLSPEALIVKVNKTGAVDVTLNPQGANGTITDITWTSDKPDVAAVTGTSETAQIAGKTAGTAIITAKATVSCNVWDAPKTFEQTCTVTVNPPELTAINVTPGNASVKVGSTQTLSAALVPNGAQGEITWTSANEAIATVEGSGTSATVKALKTGTVKITASSGAVTGECTITVSTTAPAAQKPTGITLNPKTTAVEKGKSVRIQASLTPSGSSGNITWTSSDEKTASVSADGTVTGVAAGKAVITASVQGTTLSASCSVTVTDPNGSPSASASASATAGSSSPAGAPPLPSAPGTSPGISGPPAAQPSAGPNPSQSAAPGTSEPSPEASASAKPSAVVTPAPDTPPVELKPDITDAPAPIEIVTDPDSGGSILTGVPISSPSEKTDVADVASWIEAPEGASVEIKQTDGQPASPDAAIATGMCIEVTSADGTVLQSTTVVVKGDVTGTGTMNLTQLVRMAQGYTGSSPLHGVFRDAADLNGDGHVTLTDLVLEARLFVAAGL